VRAAILRACIVAATRIGEQLRKSVQMFRSDFWRRLISLCVLVAASMSITTVDAQSVPLSVVQAGNGTLYIAQGGARGHWYPIKSATTTLPFLPNSATWMAPYRHQR
jgi:hypothetical protein